MSILVELDTQVRIGNAPEDVALREAFQAFERLAKRREETAAYWERKLASKPPCKCGCEWSIHQHYSHNTYCSHCGHAECSSYRNSRPWWWRLRIPFPNGELPCPHPV